jgi:predicted enzyme related to lactoylglutathione lyase
MPNSPVHFEIPADDVKRAKKFYEKALGWKISDPWKMNYFFVVTKEGKEEGINGGLMQRKNPGQPFMNYIGVASIDAALKKVEKAGGKVALPKMEIGSNMGWIAAFMDTEGNLMGFHQAGAAPPPAGKKAARKAVKKAAKKAAKKR